MKKLSIEGLSVVGQKPTVKSHAIPVCIAIEEENTSQEQLKLSREEYSSYTNPMNHEPEGKGSCNCDGLVWTECHEPERIQQNGNEEELKNYVVFPNYAFIFSVYIHDFLNIYCIFIILHRITIPGNAARQLLRSDRHENFLKIHQWFYR